MAAAKKATPSANMIRSSMEFSCDPRACDAARSCGASDKARVIHIRFLKCHRAHRFSRRGKSRPYKKLIKTDARRGIPQHPYEKAAGFLARSYSRKAMLIADNDRETNARLATR